MANQLDIFVTGASSGIGRATAAELASRGHRVFAGARRVAAVEELAATSERIVPVPIDVTDSDSVRAAAARIEELTGGRGIDALVNGAGYALIGPVETLSRGGLEQQFATNVFGLIDVTRAFLPRMRERGGGRVVNISSVLGRFVMPGMGAYSASKFALEALSDALRMELGEFGVSVVLIEPSWVDTALPDAAAEHARASRVAAKGYERLTAKADDYFATETSQKGMRPEAVARRIADALEAKSPKARQLFPGRSRLLAAFLGALPDRAADRAKLSTMGLR